MKLLRFIKLSAFWLFGLFSYLESVGQLPLPYVMISESDLIYDIEMHFRQKQMSGLVAVKSQVDGIHVLIFSKLGLTLTEFLLAEKEIQWIRKLPGSDKPRINRALERDFRTMLLTPLHNPDKVKAKKNYKFIVRKGIKLHVETDAEHQKILCAKLKKFLGVFHPTVDFTYENDLIPQHINLAHKLIKARISLTRLKT